jgi:hypothetical protein
MRTALRSLAARWRLLSWINTLPLISISYGLPNVANEISVTTGLQVSNGSSRRPSNQLTKNFDQVAVGIAEATFALTTSDTAFTLPITSPGHAQLRNDGSTVIEWGPDNGSGAIAVAGEISPGATTQTEMKAAWTSIRARTISGTGLLSVVIARK